ncbi:IS5 family transposase [Polaromonas naphthalenivorans]|uniref:Transposase, IS4 family n=1 Tax=Polaromonas naphthalenivorans (strain CJ2) TaxID=365044 RepID=A1VWH1_POLNA|nr:IS5 family transposase [Polaromonas naphthalenivorans]ABM39999.1 transposase, IS4 family [Polaromonas naphthalenivorans CJ2]
MRNGSVSSRSCPLARAAPAGRLGKFFDALLWMARTGAAWRDLPEQLGKWNVVYQSYAYWCGKGHFERFFQGVQQPDLEEVMVDSTCCRAHQSSACARKTSRPQVIGITRGGLNTKIHAVCDALGNPLRFVLTPGQRHDSKPVPELLEGLQAKALLADKAYDSDKMVQAAQKQGMEVLIACRVNRKKNQRVQHTHRYKARHLMENLFQRMKVFRRVATRYDKLGVTFLGFVHIAAP